MFPLISEKAVEEAVRNCEQLKRREQEEDNVTIEELEKQRVEALEVVEKEREIVEQERAVYDSIADKYLSIEDISSTTSLNASSSPPLKLLTYLHEPFVILIQCWCVWFIIGIRDSRRPYIGKQAQDGRILEHWRKPGQSCVTVGRLWVWASERVWSILSSSWRGMAEGESERMTTSVVATPSPSADNDVTVAAT